MPRLMYVAMLIFLRASFPVSKTGFVFLLLLLCLGLCRVLDYDISISDIFDKFLSKDKNSKKKKKGGDEKKKGKEGEKS